MIKTRKPTLVPVSSAIVFLLIIASQQHGTIFAMHDSNLNVNTWIASDNSTQLNTMDLNSGTMSPTAAGGEAEEDEVVDEEEVDEENEEPSLEEEEGEDESE